MISKGRNYFFKGQNVPKVVRRWCSNQHTSATIRNERKYNPSPSNFIAPQKSVRDVVIIGGGHNGLVSACYLAKKGLDVLVLERRDMIGGAAVTEELFAPGYKLSRASYVAGLLRPQIIKDLELSSKYGLKFLKRNPGSFTPTRIDDPLYRGNFVICCCFLFLNAQFSTRDADKMAEYEAFLNRFCDLLRPLLDDAPPPGVFSYNMDGIPYCEDDGKRKYEWKKLYRLHYEQYKELWRVATTHKDWLTHFYEFATAPAKTILQRWFESEILKATLCTDGMVGSLLSPSDAGSAYVLLHHVLGEIDGERGAWAYCEGGMGSITQALAKCARHHGAEIIANATVRRLVIEREYNKSLQQYVPKIKGVVMDDGTYIQGKVVLSNATPYHTFIELVPRDKFFFCVLFYCLSHQLTYNIGFDVTHTKSEQVVQLIPKDFLNKIESSDYACGSFKINCVVNQLPNFECLPNISSNQSGSQHRASILFTSRVSELEDAAREAKHGIPAKRSMIEMTIPSSLDNTLVPSHKVGEHHIVQLFVQYAPYDLNKQVFGNAAHWDNIKEQFADQVFAQIDEFAPNFSQSVLYRDLLSPRDLERVFALHKGSIFHGALSLQQIGYGRPVPRYSSYRTPIQGLYMCGSGAHPGGGVMGAPGRNCAKHVLFDLDLL
ncbi:amine oxidase-related protein [Reticulomyxa filosa]|uniref:Amine oxidase-related protein n=1 Tax=Reticulomyxa filosa TaxID=46433 RepID=X6P191_RETFI|nr:amine oxidase-related protein [Reticulomyxa filosa]|eukprot:ETO31873.1 amine oxidase-related protein [Reticulomyxa filosa]